MTLTPKDRGDRPVSAGSADGLRFAPVVDRDLVHRARSAEVYITGYASTPGDRFTVWARWPLTHPLYCPGGRYHPTLLLETMRQAVLTVCHGLLEVPYGTRFVMSRITADGLDRLPRVGPDPTQIRLDLARTPGPGKNRSEWQMSIHVGDHTTLTGGGALVLLTSSQYARIRRGYADQVRAAAPSRPIQHQRVGREHPGDVCLAGQPGGGFGLHVDQDHPIFYDHPLDHVPGALLLEAALQRAHAHHPSFRPATIETHFHAFLEPDQACTVDCTPTPEHPGRGLLIKFQQDNLIKTTVRLTAPQAGGHLRIVPVAAPVGRFPPGRVPDWGVPQNDRLWYSCTASHVSVPGVACQKSSARRW
ncbi:ScbA/BarX family gamma-butyrolactone biosynthesis protein [Leekyejoonella antrihumi]|uniref:ScbA/BarX family gamma-butyrolactone biosynthesis protein n=1 Tax=Leekyejoonella antrihumi TaxID=1660198 RepID=UPI0016482C7C|nr:ScbA/BarX family gamma-butyrolactone biosynthesis protein [Leekyejoonella antrihumi]